MCVHVYVCVQTVCGQCNDPSNTCLHTIKACVCVCGKTNVCREYWHAGVYYDSIVATKAPKV